MALFPRDWHALQKDSTLRNELTMVSCRITVFEFHRARPNRFDNFIGVERPSAAIAFDPV